MGYDKTKSLMILNALNWTQPSSGTGTRQKDGKQLVNVILRKTLLLATHQSKHLTKSMPSAHLVQ